MFAFQVFEVRIQVNLQELSKDLIHYKHMNTTILMGQQYKIGDKTLTYKCLWNFGISNI